jgi:phosphomannomutase
LSTLMVSISGIRGIIGESLTPDIVKKYALAFGSSMNKSPIIVGRDSRTSGTTISNILKGCLQATGCEVIDIGIVPTPTVQMEIIHHKAAGGVAVTASHNPSEWNGLKFMDGNGRFLSPDKAEQVFQLADRGDFKYTDWREVGNETQDFGANERHIQAVLNLPFIDVSSLKKRNFSVAIDCVNGAGGLIIPQLLKKLGCTVIPINDEANGIFAHTPEPVPENLGQLKKAVKESKTDIGFAVDPDVDRCAIVDNKGKPMGEEYTLALAVKFYLSKKLGPVVVNMSSSRASEDIAKYYNCPFVRSKVGEINVVEEMIAHEAIIGGEGNGGVILPELHLGRDAPIAVAIALQSLLEYSGSASDLVQSLPRYYMVKDKINIEGENPDSIINKLIDQFSGKKVNLLDGVKIDEEDYWVHLRKSNTEPIIRIIAEAKTAKEAQSIVREYSEIISKLS